MRPDSQSWKALLPGAFAGMTAPFGVHACDNKRAVCLLHTALREGASISDVVLEARRYLSNQGLNAEEINREEDRIRSFSPNPMTKSRMSRAWLVTLEETGKISRVVSVFKTQRSAETVRAYVEQLYIDSYYSSQEKLVYATSPKNNPFPATYEIVDGVPWQGRIKCGDNPFFYARIVENLRVLPGRSEFTWSEHPIPRFPAT